MKNKTKLCMALALACALGANAALLAGCSDDNPPDDNPPIEQETPSISLNKTRVELDVHEEVQLTATRFFLEDAVEWSSSDPLKATVDQNGLVKTLAEGTVTITAKAGDVSATCTVVITDSQTVPVMSLDLATVTLGKAGEATVTANITYKGNAVNEPVVLSWVIENEAGSAFASVTPAQDGKSATVKGLAYGSTRIIVSTVLWDVPLVQYLNVNVVNIDVEFNVENAEPVAGGFAANVALLDVGEHSTTKELAIVVTDKGTPVEDAQIAWDNSDDTVAAIAGNTVTALKEGETTLTGTYDSAILTVKITVYRPAVEINKTFTIQTKDESTHAIDLAADSLQGTVRSVKVGGTDVLKELDGGRAVLDSEKLPTSAQYMGDKVTVVVDTDKASYEYVNASVYSKIITQKSELAAMESWLDKTKAGTGGDGDYFFWDGYVVLGGNIDFGGDTYNSFIRWGTNNTVSAIQSGFRGTFDGKGYIIDNLKIDGFNHRAGGFFGTVAEKGVIKNVAFTNAIHTGYCGFVASVGGGTIENVYVSYKSFAAVGGGNDFCGTFFVRDCLGNARIKNCFVELTSQPSFIDNAYLLGAKHRACGTAQGVYGVGFDVAFREISAEVWDAPAEKFGAYATYADFFTANIDLSDWDTDFWFIDDNGIPYPQKLPSDQRHQLTTEDMTATVTAEYMLSAEKIDLANKEIEFVGNFATYTKTLGANGEIEIKNMIVDTYTVSAEGMSTTVRFDGTALNIKLERKDEYLTNGDFTYTTGDHVNKTEFAIEEPTQGNFFFAAKLKMNDSAYVAAQRNWIGFSVLFTVDGETKETKETAIMYNSGDDQFYFFEQPNWGVSLINATAGVRNAFKAGQEVIVVWQYEASTGYVQLYVGLDEDNLVKLETPLWEGTNNNNGGSQPFGTNGTVTAVGFGSPWQGGIQSELLVKFGFGSTLGKAVAGALDLSGDTVTVNKTVTGLENTALTVEGTPHRGDDITLTLDYDTDNYAIKTFTVNGEDVRSLISDNTVVLESFLKETLNIEIEFIRDGNINVTFVADSKWSADGVKVTLTKEGETAKTIVLGEDSASVTGIKVGEWNATAEIAGMTLNLGKVGVFEEGNITIDFGTAFNGAVTSGNLGEDTLVYKKTAANTPFVFNTNAQQGDFFVATRTTLLNPQEVQANKGWYSYSINMTLNGETKRTLFMYNSGNDEFYFFDDDYWNVTPINNAAVLNAFKTGSEVLFVWAYDATTGYVDVYAGLDATNIVKVGSVWANGINPGIGVAAPPFATNGTVSQIAINAYGDALGGEFQIRLGTGANLNEALLNVLGNTGKDIIVTGEHSVAGGSVTGFENKKCGDSITLNVSLDEGYEIVSLTVNGKEMKDSVSGNALDLGTYFYSELEIALEVVDTRSSANVTFTADSKWNANGVELTLTKDSETKTAIIGGAAVADMSFGDWQATANIAGTKIKLGTVAVTGATCTVDFGTVFTAPITGADLANGKFNFKSAPDVAIDFEIENSQAGSMFFVTKAKFNPQQLATTTGTHFLMYGFNIAVNGTAKQTALAYSAENNLMLFVETPWANASQIFDNNNDVYKAMTAGEEVYFAWAYNAETGSIDLYMGVSADSITKVATLWTGACETNGTITGFGVSANRTETIVNDVEFTLNVGTTLEEALEAFSA